MPMIKPRIWLLLGSSVVLVGFFVAYSGTKPTVAPAANAGKPAVRVMPTPAKEPPGLPIGQQYSGSPDPAVLDVGELEALTPLAVWEHWRVLLQKGNADLTLVTAALIQKLRLGGHLSDVYKQAANLLGDASISDSQRQELIDMLGEASTPQALKVLANLLLESNNQPLNAAIADAIARGSSGLSEWDLKPHPELSPILESLWQQLEPDQRLADALAVRIAREGADSGIKLILEQLGQNGATVADLVQANDPRSLAALHAMPEIRNPEALPLLKQVFRSQALDSAVFYASGTALSAMADLEATKVLLEWARQAPDQAANQAKQWLGTAVGSDPDSERFLTNTLTQNDDFQSSEVKQAIFEVVQERE